MNNKSERILIGDIGNTNTKICLIDQKSYKIKKVITFNSKKFYHISF